MVSEPVGTWMRRVRWDEAGRLLAAWGEGAGAPAGSWAFAYDHSGERVLKYRIEEGQVAGATLYLRDEQGNVLSEMQWVDTGAAGYWARAKDHVYLGRDLIGSFDRSTGEPHVVSYARDHLGSQRAEVWGLDTSTATDLWPYGALARTKAAGGSPALANGAHLFTGHEREYTGSEALADPLMGLDYMHARYYSNTLGRFFSVDPVGGKPGLSQSWNRYAYVRGKPVLVPDPTGEFDPFLGVKLQWAFLRFASFVRGFSDHVNEKLPAPYSVHSSRTPDGLVETDYRLGHSTADWLGRHNVVLVAEARGSVDFEAGPLGGIHATGGFSLVNGNDPYVVFGAGKSFGPKRFKLKFSPSLSFSLGLVFNYDGVGSYRGWFVSSSTAIPPVGFSLSGVPGGSASTPTALTLDLTTAFNPGVTEAATYYFPLRRKDSEMDDGTAASTIVRCNGAYHFANQCR